MVERRNRRPPALPHSFKSGLGHTCLSLLKTVKYRENLGVFLEGRHTVGRHGHHAICFRFHALVPVSQPSAGGTRACCLATSADRLAAATPSPRPASCHRPAPMGVPLPIVATGPGRLSTRHTGDGAETASQGLSGGGDRAVPDAPRQAPKSGP
jgi:hypothetical protein